MAGVASYSVDLGTVIKRRREGLSLSQEELAFRAGVHRTYVGGVERGERNITVLSLEKIAGGLGVAPSELLSEVERLRRGRRG
jgi:transcriptional regulator with XRE-family HTH domain